MGERERCTCPAGTTVSDCPVCGTGRRASVASQDDTGRTMVVVQGHAFDVESADATPTSLPADAGRGERHPDVKVIEDGVELLLKHYTAKSKQPTLDAIHVVTSIMQATRRATPSEPRGQDAGKVLHMWSDNVPVSQIGRATRHADMKKAGDDIDRGLILIRELSALGFAIVPVGGIPQGGGER